MRGVTNSVVALMAATIFGVIDAAWAVPEVTNVRMQQRTSSRIVDVWYDLAGEAAIVTLGIEPNGVAIPDRAVTRLTGDVSIVIQPGTDKHIVWNAGADWPENISESAKARVTAWSTSTPPQVMVVDLTGGQSAETYPVYYCTSLEALPYGGVTNSVYKNTHVVMRKITCGSFSMGEGTPVTVTLTNDFYAGVFEVTQGQWFNVMGSDRAANFTDASSKAFRPMEMVSYNDIRGSSAGAGWPGSDAVDATSFIGKLRAKAGNIPGFDLPTEAQWEYACRAGTTTYYNDGLGTPSVTTSNAQMHVLGRYQYNGGKVWNGTTWVGPATSCDAANGTAIVGSYLPNAWGLYDMHGNVYEWCLDWAVSGSVRVSRGGGWYSAAADCRSAYRSFVGPSIGGKDLGFRLVRTLP